MTLQQAEDFIRECDEDDELDDGTLVELFTAIYERKPDQQDRDDGLWSLCCAGVSHA